MRSTVLTLGIALLGPTAVAAPQQADSTGLAGDHFDLRGALDLFRRSKDLESFQQALNSTDSHVNNLDLNADGEVDFIQVRTLADGEARVVVLSSTLGKDDAQDIAAIQMERRSDGVVALQMRGDDALYPDSTIIEPTEAAREPGGKGGPMVPGAQVTVWVNVWAWPSVQWCYGPFWWEWSSPWYWGYYPPWWRPWRPWGWSVWWGFPRPYWAWYHPVHVCHVVRANSLYRHRRVASPSVARRPDARRPRPIIQEERPAKPRELQPSRQQERALPQPARPERRPDARPERKPAERMPPSRTMPPPGKAPQSPPPNRAPGRAPVKR